MHLIIVVISQHSFMFIIGSIAQIQFKELLFFYLF